MKGEKVSDHLKKKAKIHRPKSSQVVPLNVVTEVIEEEEESENGIVDRNRKIKDNLNPELELHDRSRNRKPH